MILAAHKSIIGEAEIISITIISQGNISCAQKAKTESKKRIFICAKDYTFLLMSNCIFISTSIYRNVLNKVNIISNAASAFRLHAH